MNDQGMIFYRYRNNELNPEAIQGDNIPEWALQANTRKFSGCFCGTKGKDFQLLIVSGNRQHIGLLHPQSKITGLGQLTAGYSSNDRVGGSHATETARKSLAGQQYCHG